MSVTPAGWVEVRDIVMFQPTRSYWLEAIRVQPFTYEAWGYLYEEDTFSLFENVFGIVSPGNDPREVQPIAAGRGIPDDSPYQAHLQFKELAGESNSSWVLWSELKPFLNRIPTQDVKTLFQLMEVLAAHYGEDGVRMIFWVVH